MPGPDLDSDLQPCRTSSYLTDIVPTLPYSPDMYYTNAVRVRYIYVYRILEKNDALPDRTKWIAADAQGTSTYSRSEYLPLDASPTSFIRQKGGCRNGSGLGEKLRQWLDSRSKRSSLVSAIVTLTPAQSAPLVT